MVKKKALNLYLSDGTIEAIRTYAHARGWNPETSRSRVIEEAIAALTGDNTHICAPIAGSSSREKASQELTQIMDFLKEMKEEISSVKGQYVCLDHAQGEEENTEKICAEPKHRETSKRVPLNQDFLGRLRKFTINEITEKTGLPKTTIRDIYTLKNKTTSKKNYETLQVFLETKEM